MENEILNKYFDEKLKQIDIAKKLNISKYKVSRVVTKDPRYKKEKENRKEKNRIEHINKTKNYINSERKKRNDDIGYAEIKQAHIQASMELSGGRKPMNNRAFRNWNTSIYEYSSNIKSYKLKKGINVGADVPKRISWKN